MCCTANLWVKVQRLAKVYSKSVRHHLYRGTEDKVRCALKWGKRLGHPIQHWGEVQGLSPQRQLARVSNLRAVGTCLSPSLNRRVPKINGCWIVQHFRGENCQLEMGIGVGRRGAPECVLHWKLFLMVLKLSSWTGHAAIAWWCPLSEIWKMGVTPIKLLLFYAEAEQIQINGTKSASTILQDLILWIITYPLERKILIGLQSCEWTAEMYKQLRLRKIILSYSGFWGVPNGGGLL